MKIYLSPEVQKNEIDQDVLGVSFASDWLKGAASFLDQSQRRVGQN